MPTSDRPPSRKLLKQDHFAGTDKLPRSRCRPWLMSTGAAVTGALRAPVVRVRMRGGIGRRATRPGARPAPGRTPHRRPPVPFPSSLFSVLGQRGGVQRELLSSSMPRRYRRGDLQVRQSTPGRAGTDIGGCRRGCGPGRERCCRAVTAVGLQSAGGRLYGCLSADRESGRAADRCAGAVDEPLPADQSPQSIALPLDVRARWPARLVRLFVATDGACRAGTEARGIGAC